MRTTIPAKVLATYWPQGNELGAPGLLPATVVEVGDRSEATLEVEAPEGNYTARNVPLGQYPGAYILGAPPAPAPQPDSAPADDEEEIAP